MKKFILSALLLLLFSVPVHAFNVSVGSATANPGEAFSVDINFDDNSIEVYAVDLVLVYDASLLQVESVTTGSTLTGWASAVNKNEAGVVRMAYYASESLTAASGQLARINFRVKTTAPQGSSCALSLSKAVFDATNASETANGVFRVPGGTNQAPIINNNLPLADRQAQTGSLLSFVIPATDPDGDPVTFSFTPAITGATIGASTGLFSWTPTTSQAGNYTVTVRAADPGGLFDTETFNIAVTSLSLPVITSHPSNVTVTEGQPATFAVSATGTGLTYQWQIREAGTTTFTDINGATNPSYQLTTAMADNNDGFRCLVTNGAGTSISNTATLTVNPITYTLNIAASNGSVIKRVNGSVTTATVFNKGTVVELTAVPNTGYAFTGWTGGLTGSANPASITMSGNMSVTASFSLTNHTLTLNALHGSVVKKVNGSVVTATSFPYGTVVELTAVADTGYSFGSWSGDVTGTTNPTTITINANKTVTAGFTANSYTLTTSATNGSIVKKVGGIVTTATSFTYGTQVELTATPNTGYSFTGWSGDVTGSTSPVIITINGNKSVSAGFTINTYTLTTSATNGSIVKKVGGAVTTATSFPYGTQVELTATPNTGYSFDGWSGDVTGLVNPVVITINGNKSVNASFTINNYTLTTSATNGSIVKKVGGAVTSATSFPYGTQVELTATANTGYSFTGWGGDATGSANPVIITINGNKSVHANFTINNYSLNITAVNGTVIKKVGGSLTTATSFPYNTAVELTATPNSGYSFGGWSGDVSGMVSTNTIVVIMNSNRTITANFPALGSYTLSISSPNGTVTKRVNGAITTATSFIDGTVVELTAAANTGYSFAGWTGDAAGTANPVAVTMNANKSVTAVMTANNYTLTTSATNGTITKKVGGVVTTATSFPYGTQVELTATPNTGYSFTGWSGDATGSTSPVIITINGNKSVSAAFLINSYSLSLNPAAGGTIVKRVNGAVTTATSFPYNTAVELTAVPNTGYSFTGWGSDAAGTLNPVTVIMTSNKSVTAGFSTNSFTLTINSATGGSVVKRVNGAVTSATSFPYNTVVELTAVPNTGYSFTGWSGDAAGMANPVTVTITGNKSVTPSFSLNSYSLTVNAVNGSVTKRVNGAVTTATTFAYGTVVELTAAPNTGYSFGGWSGDAIGTANPVLVTINSAKTVTASFAALGSYSLAINAPNGTVTKKVNGVITTATSFLAGTEVELTAVPNTGYTFTNWTGDATGGLNPVTVLMSGNKSVGVVFSPNKFNFITSAQNGSIVKRVNGAITTSEVFTYGTVVELTAVPANGYQFSSWSGSVTGSANPVSVTVNSDKNVAASFTTIPPQTLTISAQNGTVTKRVNGAVTTATSFAYGTVVELTATPNSGYNFSGWSGDATGTSNPVTVTMTAARSVTASFTALPTHSLMITALNGTVTKRVNGAVTTATIFPHGTVVELTASPNSGFSFTAWSGSVSGTANPVSVTMDANKSVTAGFQAVSGYTLTLSGNNGQVIKKVNGAVTSASVFEAGTVVELTAVPNSTYYFANWSGSLGGTVNPAQITMTANKTVNANFKPITYTLTVNALNGQVKKRVNGADVLGSTFTVGTVVELTAVPSYGYKFVGWGGALAGSGNPTSVTMTADQTVTAVFEALPVYNLNISVANGTVTKRVNGLVTTASAFPQGTVVDLHVAPNQGYYFAGWSGAASGTAADTSVTVNGPLSVTANIEQYSYDLNLIYSNGNVIKKVNGVPTTATSFPSGTIVELTAVPAVDYELVNWSGAISGTAATVSITMTTNKTVYANFAAIKHQLTISAPNGSVIKRVNGVSTPLTSFAKGTVVELEAVPNYGYAFTGWSGSLSGTVNPVTVVMDGDKVVTANTVLLPVYPLTVNAPNANVQLKVNGLIKNYDVFPEGTQVQVYVQPLSGYYFNGWSGDATGTANPLTITINKATTLNASIIQSQFTLNLVPDAGGRVVKKVNGVVTEASTFPANTVVEVTAVPDEGYQFLSWSGSASGSTNPLVVTVNNSKTIYVNFAVITHNLNITAVNGKVTKRVNGSLHYGLRVNTGTTVELTAEPAYGYKFVGWAGDLSGSANPTTIYMDSEKNVTANFQALPWYPVTINIENATVVKRVNGEIKYDNTFPLGAQLELRVTPNAGYVFNGWSGSVNSTSNPVIVTVTGNMVLNADVTRSQFTLTVSPNYGTVQKRVNGVVTDAVSFPSGTVVELVPYPQAGYAFNNWSGAASGTAAPYYVTMTSNKLIYANFLQVKKTLQITAVNGSVVKRVNGAITYLSSFPLNTNVQLEAKPAAGYKFVGWSGDATGAASPVTVNMSVDRSVTAIFAPI